MTAARVLRFQLHDLLRSRWVAGYALLLFALTELLAYLGGGERALPSLMNVVLIVVPLVSVVFGTMYLYGAREFIELLLAQPVGRGPLFAGLYGGLALPLCGALLLGMAPPVVWSAAGGAVAGPLTILLAAGILLTLVFTALAFLVSLLVVDRARGLGAAILLWFAATALYDGLLVLLATSFTGYPLELPLLTLVLLNPVDLGRVLLVLRFDPAGLMGYTGAVFERFFGSAVGLVVTIGALGLWTLVPYLLGRRYFARKDF